MGIDGQDIREGAITRIHSHLQTALAVSRYGVGGHSDDGDVAALDALCFADGSRGIEAIRSGGVLARH